MHFKIKDVMSILEDEEAIAKLPLGMAKITLDDGSKHPIHTGDMLIHGILWKSIYAFNRKVDATQIYTTYPVTGKMLSRCLTAQYKKLLKECPDIPHMTIVYRLWESIFDVYRFIYINLSAYQCSADLGDLIEVIHSEELRDLCLKDLPDDGTDIAEIEFRRRSKELCRILSDPKAMKHNPLLHFMQTGVLKANQVPQLLMGLGTRDDINGQMFSHVMNCSGVSGMRSLKDYATESASPKKTTHFNTTIIKTTQSFYREMRLLTCNLNVAHKGDCGRRMYIQHIIEKGRGHNYVDKIVQHDGKLVAITDENFREFEGHKVGLVSPIACKHVDGVCEHCAGRNTDKPWAFIPDVRIGGYSSAVVFSDISQKVLSAKHLIQTFTVAVMMSDLAHKYLNLDAKSNLKLNRQIMKNLKDWSLLIETAKVGHPNDLKFTGITPIGFGKFGKVGFYNNVTKESVFFPITTNDMTQYFSQEMLDHMREFREDISIMDAYYKIPLEGYNSRRAIIETVAKNDDMVAFANRVRTMFRSGISEYPNIELALSNIANEIHSKVDANIFFIELIIKAILNSVLADDGRIDISSMRETIASNNVAAKLSHSHVRTWLYSPEVCVEAKQPSPFDWLFGFVN